MCGICGIWFPRSSGRTVDAAAIRCMTASIAHRGPDAESQHVTGHVGLGHRRLSIIDLQTGDQPMTSADGSCRIVYNGEIYNFRELRAELEALGSRFRTRSDTEVIVEGFARWGEKVLDRLSGMFAFALHDIANDRLFLVRDRLGIKPLYFSWAGEALVFGSEVRALLASGLVSKDVEQSLIDAYVTLGYVPGEQTLFKNVNKLPPAHYMVVDESGHELKQYWDLAAVRHIEIGTEEAIHRFTEKFTKTVEHHLISDVPLGAFLSGGVDSSAVVAFVRGELGRPLATFSVGYRDDPSSNELPFASMVAKRFGTDHHEFLLTHDDFFAGIDSLIEHSEEPIVESPAVALMGISKHASSFATVFLSGEGADETFAGYDLYGRNLALQRLERALGQPTLRALSALLKPFSATERVSKYRSWIASSLEERYRSIPADVTPELRSRIYKTALETGVDAHFRSLFDQVPHLDTLSRMQYVDIKTWLVDDLLLKADKMTMAASIELRVPFLDHEIVEFGLSLPAAVKRRRRVGKAFLKQLLTRHLPRELLYRPKQGFPVPIAKWLRGDLHERARNILLDKKSRIRAYVREDYITECLDRHRAGSEDRSRRIFAMLVLELWHRKFIDPVELSPA